jgi:hypothetical protein
LIDWIRQSFFAPASLFSTQPQRKPNPSRWRMVFNGVAQFGQVGMPP